MYSQISISLSLDQIHKIDQYAKYQNMSRSQFLRTIVQSTIERLSDSSGNYSHRMDSQIMQSLEYRISKLKLELRGLQHQLDISNEEGLNHD